MCVQLRDSLELLINDYMGSSDKSCDDMSTRSPTLVQTRFEVLKTLTEFLFREIESLQEVLSPREGREIGEKLNLQSAIRIFEAELILNALIRCGGNQSKAAKLLKIKGTTLNAKIKRYRIEMPEDTMAARDT
jgi:DNA-binding NtrC family response regulator